MEESSLSFGTVVLWLVLTLLKVVVVGFGISTPEQVRAVAAVADGVVVGSALVNSIAKDPSDCERVLENLSERLAYLTS